MGKEKFKEWKKIGLDDAKQDARKKFYEKYAKLKGAIDIDVSQETMAEREVNKKGGYLFGALKAGLGSEQKAYKVLQILTQKGFNVDKIAKGTKVAIRNGLFYMINSKGENIANVNLGEDAPIVAPPEEEPAPEEPAPEEPAPEEPAPEKEEFDSEKVKARLEEMTRQGIMRQWTYINKKMYTNPTPLEGGSIRIANATDDNAMMDEMLEYIAKIKPSFSAKNTDFVLHYKYYYRDGSSTETRLGGDTVAVPEKATLRVINNGDGSYSMQVKWTGNSFETGKNAPFYKEKVSEYDTND